MTIPYGEGRDGTTAIFTGQPEHVRRDIVVFFGIDREAVAGLTLSDLVLNASQLARAAGTIATQLGGRVIADTGTASPSHEGTGEAAWASATARPAEPAAEPEPHPLLERIAQAGDIPTLQRIWATSQDAFKDQAVMAAWKAKGRTLQQAA